MTCDVCKDSVSFDTDAELHFCMRYDLFHQLTIGKKEKDVCTKCYEQLNSELEKIVEKNLEK